MLRQLQFFMLMWVKIFLCIGLFIFCGYWFYNLAVFIGIETSIPHITIQGQCAIGSVSLFCVLFVISVITFLSYMALSEMWKAAGTKAAMYDAYHDYEKNK